MVISAQKAADAAKIETLLDICFGLDRFDKSSYALRRGVQAIKGLGYVYRDGDTVVGSIQYWPAYLQNIITGKMQEVLILGPLAVHPDYQGQGIASALMRRSLSTVRHYGYSHVMLVGDENLYKKYGFVKTAPFHITMPDNRDADRILVQNIRGGALNIPTLGTLVPYKPMLPQANVGIGHDVMVGKVFDNCHV